jgi:hypothetical protein
MSCAHLYSRHIRHSALPSLGEVVTSYSVMSMMSGALHKRGTESEMPVEDSKNRPFFPITCC